MFSQPHGFCRVQEQKLCIYECFLNLINDAKVNYCQTQKCIYSLVRAVYQLKSLNDYIDQ
jgi:hypothetical protein